MITTSSLVETLDPQFRRRRSALLMENQERGESSRADDKRIQSPEAGLESSSMASCSSDPATKGMTNLPVIVDECSRCSSVTSPVVTTVICPHKFCAKCILNLWSQQNLREPCACPFDGKHIIYIRPCTTLDESEELASLANVYNRLFRVIIPPFKPYAKYGGILSRLYYVDLALFLTGLFAYYVKVHGGDGP